MTRKAQLKSSAAMPAAGKVSARGEGVLDLGDKQLRLKLTLAAMNRIETEFELESIDQLEEVMARPSAKKICFLIRALTMGDEPSDADILGSQIAREGSLEELVARLGAVMTGGAQAEAKGEAADLGNAIAPSA